MGNYVQSLEKYDVLAVLNDARDSRLLRVKQSENGNQHILKVLKDEFSGPDVRAALTYEHDLLKRMNARTDGVMKVGDLRPYGHGLAIEMEDIDATSLEASIDAIGPCLGDLAQALRLAKSLANVVAEIHSAGVVHKALCPENILLHARDGSVRVINFERATELATETADLTSTDLPAERLHHLAPEQSGRMNRSIDQRTDLYSLGTVLFQLFTGHPPFHDASRDQDRLAILHAHLARRPPRVRDLNDKVPGILSDIVGRLLEKNVTDRYQSARGLAADLETCARQHLEAGIIEDFPLGRHDFWDRLTPPQRLYGRNAEIQGLMSIFERARAGSAQLALVHGYSGIGKSALVNELLRPNALANGTFVSGKFDLNVRDQPYSAFQQALKSLITQRLQLSQRLIDRLANDLKEALGPNGSVTTDLLPEVELIIGPQPPVPRLGPEEAQNRFSRVFEAFLGRLATPEHPLVLFIDDLQWADTPSLTLLRRIMSSGTVGHLLIVGAYRDNEVDASHPLTFAREALEADGVAIGDIALQPLGADDVSGMISEMLRRPPAEISDLVELCNRKTGGNPFFLNQFLLALNEEGLLTFDLTDRAWRWDLPGIQKREYTDNVVELVVERIRRMPEDVSHTLSMAACIGGRFDLATLAAIVGRTAETVADFLWPALQENLILPMSAGYRGAHWSEGFAEVGGANVSYRFLHDRVQQAAYGMLNEDGRRRTHLDIARLHSARLNEESPSEIWFDAVAHFNNAAPLLDTRDEQRKLAGLNLGAARRAIAAAAFEPAAEYARAGLDALPADTWGSDYELARDLHLEAIEAAYLTRDFDRMAELAQTVDQQSTTIMDTVRLRDIQLRSLIAQDKRSEAIAVALPLLADLGAQIPANPTDADYGAGFGGAEGAIQGRSVSDLIDLPDMEDEHAKAAMRILCLIFSAAYFTAPQLLPLIIAKLVELSGRHGNTGESAFGYAVYGLNLCAFEGNIERGFEFGELSRAVLDKYDARALRARTLFIANICVTHWKRPVSATLEPLLDAYQSGLDTGDIEYSTHALMIRNQHLFAVGHPLDQLHARMAGQRAAIVASKEEAAVSLFEIYHQSIGNWLHPSEDPVLLSGVHYDEGQMRVVHEKVGDRTALFHLHYNKMVLAYGFGRNEQAADLAEAARSYLDGAVGVHQIPLFHFYDSLIALSGGASDQDARIVENQAKIRNWADHCPENNLHRWHLVEAERAAQRGQVLEAAEHFDKAASLAERHGYVQEEALAYERQALFWKARENQTLTSAFLEQAAKRFALWGSEAKLAHLAREHGFILTQDGADPGKAGKVARTVDIDTVLKASAALAGSTELEGLLSQMMQITMENAGARRGHLLLGKRGRLVSAASASSEADDVRLSSDLSIDGLDELDDNAPLLVPVARFVARTGRSVMIDDASTDQMYGATPYVKQNKCRSILCLPLSYQGKLVALLYLENDLAAGAFTEDRLELLKLLSGQMAVLIENAQFYAEVMQINRAYERFVPKQFLSFLGRDSITDVQLGDQISRDMTIMFVDIRAFTELSEAMSPEETFGFINDFLQTIEPHVARHGGFVDKYTGDGLMALFPNSADDAVRSALDILGGLKTFNARRKDAGGSPINIGIGLHSGRLMLGTIGGEKRMDGTVIWAAVNLASSIEGMNKTFGTQFLLSKETLSLLRDDQAYQHRHLGSVTVKGGARVSLHEIFDADAPALIQQKRDTAARLETAIRDMAAGEMSAAAQGFEAVLARHRDDRVASFYLREMQAGPAINRTAPE